MYIIYFLNIGDRGIFLKEDAMKETGKGLKETGKGLVDLWNWAAEKGLMNKNTANAHRAACTQVLGVLEDWEEREINQLDLDDVINRFKNLRAQDFKPKTLRDYENRFRRAVQLFQDYIHDPSSWSPTKSNTSSRRSPKKSEAKPPKTTEDSTGDEGDVLAEITGLVKYPFPLRQDIIAYLQLPDDLTSDEVKRLHTFMQALVVEF